MNRRIRSTLFPVFSQWFVQTVRTYIKCQQHYKVVIVGGGTGGSTVASRLARTLREHTIAVIDPCELHYYQPLWTLVGAGIKPMKESTKLMQDVLPSGIPWLKERVTQMRPDASTIQLESGKEITYDHVVLSLGLELRFDLIHGATEALEADPRVLSNYASNYVEKTFKAYQNFKGGCALFTFPVGPIKCAGAPQKVMYLFEDYLRRAGRRDSADIQYFTSLAKLFSVDKYAESLAAICHGRNIHYHLNHHLVHVDWVKSEATMENLKTNKLKKLHYDMLHITPPMTAPEVLKQTPKLTNPDYVQVNPNTLQHEHYHNVWALGDCSSLPTSKTAAAIAAQATVLCKNLRSVIDGGSANVASYDGYTACPLVTSYNRGILAEFDYNLRPVETLPFDQSRELFILYFLKAEVMPTIYWHWMVRGRWSGPKLVRQLLHFGLSK